jgi:hypothetical protein
MGFDEQASLLTAKRAMRGMRWPAGICVRLKCLCLHRQSSGHQKYFFPIVVFKRFCGERPRLEAQQACPGPLFVFLG